MSKIFISYSHEDKDFVQLLFEALAKENYEIWVDWENIPLTADWWQTIAIGINEADTFLFVISPQSVVSAICNFEMAHALANNKRVVPIIKEIIDEKQLVTKLTQIQLTDLQQELLAERDFVSLGRKNWQELSRYNWANFQDVSQFDAEFRKLTADLRRDTDNVQLHTKLLSRAHDWEQSNNDKTKRDPSLLLRGTDLFNAEDWLARYFVTNHDEQNTLIYEHPTQLHQDYIVASRVIERQRQRVQISSISGALIITIALLILAVILFQNANIQRNRAETSEATSIANEATAVRQANISESLRLAELAKAKLSQDDSQLAIALAWKASQLSNPPARTMEVLSEIAYVAPRMTYQGHSAPITSIAIHPSGQSFLAASCITTTELDTPDLCPQSNLIHWDMQSGEVLHYFEGHSGGVFDVVFSGNGDIAVSSGYDGLIVWDVESASPLAHFFEDEAIRNIAITSDGQYVLYSISDTMILFDVQTGEETHTFHSWGESFLDIAITPDDSFAVTGDYAGLSLWNLVTGQLVYFKPAEDRIDKVVINHDGSLVLSASYAGAILWDLELGIEQSRIAQEGLKVVAFSPDDTFILFGLEESRFVSEERGIVLWDIELGQPTRYVVDASFSPNAVAFSPNGEYLLVGGAERYVLFGDTAQWIGANLKMWDRSILPSVQTYPDFQFSKPIFSPDGQQFLTGNNRTVVLWDTTTGLADMQFTSDSILLYQNPVAFNPDGQTLITKVCQSDALAVADPSFGCATVTLYEWDIATQEITGIWPVPGKAITVEDAIFARHGLFTSGKNQIHLWNIETDEVLQAYEGHGEWVNAIAVHPNERFIASVGCEAYEPASYRCAYSNILLHDIATGDIIQVYEGHTNYVYELAFSQDGNQIISASEQDKSIVVWDTSTAEILKRIDVSEGDEQISLTLNSDGSRAIISTRNIAGTGQGIKRVLDIDKGENVCRYAELGFQFDDQFTPDDSMILSKNDNQYVLWRPCDTQELTEWVANNRYIPDLTCEQRATYLLDTQCVE